MAMRRGFGNRGTTDAVAILTPGVIGGRFVRFLGLVEMVVNVFRQDDLRLPQLLVEDRVVEGMALVKDSNLTFGVFTNGDLSFAEGVGRAVGLDLVDNLVVLEGQVFGQDAGFLARKEEVEFILGEERWTVCSMLAAGFDSKTVVEILNVIREESIGLLNGANIP